MTILAIVFVLLLIMVGLACVWAERQITHEEIARDRDELEAEWGRS